MASIAEAGPIAALDRSHDRRAIRTWLHIVALMIVAMVVVGGATRLTESGLSITEWKPIHGIIPPLNEQEWQEEFARYKQIPQYEIVNAGMSLAEFQTIFWWEWAHRLLGRAIGIVVFIPLVFFWVTGRLEPRLRPHMVALFLLGGLQGAVGWWMVASGLTERIDVSQYRLTVHLTLACLILAYTVWIARSIAPSCDAAPRRLHVGAGTLVALILIQIALGGMVAGMNAGFVYNTWPLMDGRFVPASLLDLSPWWANFGENIAAVQFAHRIGAYVLFAAGLIYAWQARGTAQAGRALFLAGLITGQAMLGILTLLHVVALPLALLHQLGAVVVLWAAVSQVRGMSPPLPVTG